MNHKSALKKIEETVLTFQTWHMPWKFESYISHHLENDALTLFKNIWKVAADYKNWSKYDLCLGEEITLNLLKERFDLTEIACKQIIKAVVYEWR
ncbi:hypothetical protein [Pedobacter boryungensis]|uniref:Uncharacterized protein n=1 Tax=Pedobacter boryungensis TaxID=869962 RepID=A0ABX2DG49_9SPHI|nr:hypothetical protein [Pedobacter boryungensis]NQX33076.1 hypothetical protein [Pedobacter boryungensis]